MKVTLNKKSTIFHDPILGVTLIGTEVKELTETQLAHPRIIKAIRNGHLEVVTEVPVVPAAPVEAPDTELDSLVEKIEEYISDEVTADKIKDRFSLAELKLLAEYYDIELEEEDTKIDIVNAILDSRS